MNFRVLGGGSLCALLYATNLLAAADEYAFRITLRSEVDDVATANGFCRGQAMTSAALAEAVPTRRAALQLELARFDRETGYGCRELESGLRAYMEELSSKAGGSSQFWQDYSRTVERALSDQLAKAYQGGYSEAAADLFLKEMAGRRKGKMDEEILGTILSASREFRRYPELEVSRGFGEVFSTSGLTKSRGIRMQLKVPLSWKGKEGDGPRVVQKWTSKIDASGAFASLILMALPATPAEMAEIRSEFTTGVLPREFRQMLPGEAVVEGVDQVQLMFRPAMRATFQLRSRASDRDVVQKNLFYMALADNGVVTMQCGVITFGDPSKITALLERYRKVCELSAVSMLDLSHIQGK